MKRSAILTNILAVLTCQLMATSAGAVSTSEANATEVHDDIVTVRRPPPQHAPPLPQNDFGNLTSGEMSFVERSTHKKKPKKKLEWPEVGNWRSTLITEPPASSEFPLGRAPFAQRNCEVGFATTGGWYPGFFFILPRHMRRRIIFTVPRNDIPKEMIEKVATGLWHWGIFYNPRSERGPQHCKTKKNQHFNIEASDDGTRWHIDFDQTLMEAYHNNGRCLMAWFVQSWGQWTGCRYNETLNTLLHREANGQCNEKAFDPFGYPEPLSNPCHFD